MSRRSRCVTIPGSAIAYSAVVSVEHRELRCQAFHPLSAERNLAMRMRKLFAVLGIAAALFFAGAGVASAMTHDGVQPVPAMTHD